MSDILKAIWAWARVRAHEALERVGITPWDDSPRAPTPSDHVTHAETSKS